MQFIFKWKGHDSPEIVITDKSICCMGFLHYGAVDTQFERQHPGPLVIFTTVPAMWLLCPLVVWSNTFKHKIIQELMSILSIGVCGMTIFLLTWLSLTCYYLGSCLCLFVLCKIVGVSLDSEPEVTLVVMDSWCLQLVKMDHEFESFISRITFTIWLRNRIIPVLAC